MSYRSSISHSSSGGFLLFFRRSARSLFEQWGRLVAQYQIATILATGTVIFSLIFSALDLYFTSPHPVHLYDFLAKPLQHIYPADTDIWWGDDVQVSADERCWSLHPVSRAIRVEPLYISNDAVINPHHGDKHSMFSVDHGVIDKRTLHNTLSFLTEFKDSLRSKLQSHEQTIEHDNYNKNHNNNLPAPFDSSDPWYIGSTDPLHVWDYDEHKLLSDMSPLTTLQKQSIPHWSFDGLPVSLSSTFAHRTTSPLHPHLHSAQYIVHNAIFVDSVPARNTYRSVLQSIASSYGRLLPFTETADRHILLKHHPLPTVRPLSSRYEDIFILIGYVGVGLYVYLTLRRIDRVHSRTGLVLTGLVQMFCSGLVSLSVCKLVKVQFGLVPWKLIPFLILVLGVDSNFILIRAVTATSVDLPIRDRIARGVGAVGLQIVSSLAVEVSILMICFLIVGPGSIRELLLFALVAIFADYALQSTLFLTVLSIDIQRLELADLLRLRQGGKVSGRINGRSGSSKYANNTSSESSSWSVIVNGFKAGIRARIARAVVFFLLVGANIILYIRSGASYYLPPFCASLPISSLESNNTPLNPSSPEEKFWHLLNPNSAEMVHVSVSPPTIISLGQNSDIANQSSTLISKLMFKLFSSFKFILPVIVIDILVYFLLRYLLKGAELLRKESPTSDDDHHRESLVKRAQAGSIPLSMHTYPITHDADLEVMASAKNRVFTWSTFDDHITISEFSSLSAPASSSTLPLTQNSTANGSSSNNNTTNNHNSSKNTSQPGSSNTNNSNSHSNSGNNNTSNNDSSCNTPIVRIPLVDQISVTALDVDEDAKFVAIATSRGCIMIWEIDPYLRQLSFTELTTNQQKLSQDISCNRGRVISLRTHPRRDSHNAPPPGPSGQHPEDRIVFYSVHENSTILEWDCINLKVKEAKMTFNPNPNPNPNANPDDASAAPILDDDIDSYDYDAHAQVVRVNQPKEADSTVYPAVARLIDNGNKLQVWNCDPNGVWSQFGKVLEISREWDADDRLLTVAAGNFFLGGSIRNVCTVGSRDGKVSMYDIDSGHQVSSLSITLEQPVTKVRLARAPQLRCFTCQGQISDGFFLVVGTTRQVRAYRVFSAPRECQPDPTPVTANSGLSSGNSGSMMMSPMSVWQIHNSLYSSSPSLSTKSPPTSLSPLPQVAASSSSSLSAAASLAPPPPPSAPSAPASNSNNNNTNNNNNNNTLGAPDVSASNSNNNNMRRRRSINTQNGGVTVNEDGSVPISLACHGLLRSKGASSVSSSCDTSDNDTKGSSTTNRKSSIGSIGGGSPSSSPSPDKVRIRRRRPNGTNTIKEDGDNVWGQPRIQEQSVLEKDVKGTWDICGQAVVGVSRMSASSINAATTSSASSSPSSTSSFADNRKKWIHGWEAWTINLAPAHGSTKGLPIWRSPLALVCDNMDEYDYRQQSHGHGLSAAADQSRRSRNASLSFTSSASTSATAAAAAVTSNISSNNLSSPSSAALLHGTKAKTICTRQTKELLAFSNTRCSVSALNGRALALGMGNCVTLLERADTKDKKDQ